MKKAAIRNAASVFLRDTGAARHYKQDALDEWLHLAFDQLVSDAHEANADFYNAKQILNFTESIALALTSPTPLTLQFVRPLRLEKVPPGTTSALVKGEPYDFVRRRDARARTAYFIAGTNLAVEPSETATFLFEYVFRPTAWKDLEETDEPLFPPQFHQLIAVEGAMMAVGEAGRGRPGALGETAARLRENFQAYLGRFNETGPMQAEVADDVYEGW